MTFPLFYSTLRNFESCTVMYTNNCTFRSILLKKLYEKFQLQVKNSLYCTSKIPYFLLYSAILVNQYAFRSDTIKKNVVIFGSFHNFYAILVMRN
jgi:hypothetical protein